MDLWHATTQQSLTSIKNNGLDPLCTKGKTKGVWLHSKSKREWAILHTQKRHKVSLDQIVLIQVSVSRKHLTRKWKGIWVCGVTIKSFKSIIEAAELC